MEPTLTIEDKIMVWNYEKLNFLQACGICPYNLSNLRPLYDQNTAESSKVRRIEGQKVLGAFVFNPTITILFTQEEKERPIRESGLSIIALNKAEAKQRISEISAKYDFKLKKWPEIVIDSLCYEVKLLLRSRYEYAKIISIKNRQDLEITFGALEYAHFLVKTKDFDENLALRKASLKFNVALPRRFY